MGDGERKGRPTPLRGRLEREIGKGQKRGCSGEGRQVKAGPRQGKKRTERSRKSLSCWFRLGQGAADPERKG